MKTVDNASVPESNLTVGKVFKVFGGGTPSTSVPKFWQGSIPWITSADLDDDLKITARKSITKEAVDASATNLVPAGSVIVATRVGLGKVGVAEAPLCFSQDCQGLIIDTKTCDPKFAALQLKQRVQIFQYISRGTTINGVTKKQLLDLPFDLPPLTEQRSIVAEIEKQFSRLDEAVANIKRVKLNLKRYKAAVLKAAVEGRPGSSDPRSWTRTNLGTVLTTIEAGKSFKCQERLPNIREVGVVKVSAVTWGTYNEKESKTCLDSDRIETRYFVQTGDFLFSRANTIQLVGACVIARKVTQKIMLSDKILRFRFSDKILPQWVLYWLRSDIGRKEIQRLSTGNQESMRNIGQDRIRQIAFALPSLEEQRAIVAEVERRLSVIDELEVSVDTNLKRADRLRHSILGCAFEGKLVLI